jgi:serine/threonine-protein kinase
MALQPGQVIDGKYRIVRLIGEGGMGAVYEGQNTSIRRRVAIKILHAGVASNTEMVQRFEREAQVAGTVGNDHILEILDLGALPAGERYMVMEFLDGETLTDRIKSRGRLLPAEAFAIVRQVLRGLAAAHAAGIVHRDLKPDNIFILKEKAGHKDFVKIIDFGISKFTEPGGASSRMTRTGALMGTPHYMAPEQATGSSDIDQRTDIYAVGIILYEALTGRVPFQAETFNQLLFEIALAKLIPARQFVPDLDPAVDSILLKASARDPRHRFQSCAEFLEAIDDYERSGRAVSLPPEQSIEAIVAATVPRTGQMPSVSDVPATMTAPATLSASNSDGVSDAASVASASPAPTLNSWANTGEHALPKKGSGLVMVATVAGVLLLFGGGAAAYFMSRPGPNSRVDPAANSSAAVPSSAATTASDTNAAPQVSAAPPPASAAVAEPPTVAPSPAPVVAPAAAPSATVRVQSRQHAAQPRTPAAAAPAPAPDKPKTKKAINFGY